MSGARKGPRARQSPAFMKLSVQQEHIRSDNLMNVAEDECCRGALGADGRVREDSVKQEVLDMKVK